MSYNKPIWNLRKYSKLSADLVISKPRLILMFEKGAKSYCTLHTNTVFKKLGLWITLNTCFKLRFKSVKTNIGSSLSWQRANSAHFTQGVYYCFELRFQWTPWLHLRFKLILRVCHVKYQLKKRLTWKHKSDSSTKKVANFPEQSFIQQRSVKASILPFHFVLDKIVKKLLYCPALPTHSVDNTLVNSFQNKRNSAHQSWFQQIGITFGTTCHFGAFACQCCRWA